MSQNTNDYCIAGNFVAVGLSEARETARTRAADGRGTQDIRTYSPRTGNVGKVIEVHHEDGSVQTDGYFGSLRVG